MFKTLLLLAAFMPPQTIDAGRGPVQVISPTHSGPAPLVLMLHGGCSDGAAISEYISLKDLDNYYEISPNGRPIFPFPCLTWYSTQEYEPGNILFNDSAYLRELILRARQQLPITQVIVIGHSVGGFMAYRIAAEHSDLIDKVICIGGAVWYGMDYTPTQSVDVLHIHGSADLFTWPQGSWIYYGAVGSCLEWAETCRRPHREGRMDLTLDIPGADTIKATWPCQVELWYMIGVGHTPLWTNNFKLRLRDWINK